MNLVLHLKFEYYDQIERGEKLEEYRLASKWEKRIVGKNFDNVVLWRGYQSGKFMVLPWRGYTRKTITHPHFGNGPVDVFAINVQAGPGSKPKRIQRKRTKNWRMPENTVYVGRPTKWGNSYKIESEEERADAVESFEIEIKMMITRRGLNLSSLRGKDLACWCPLEKPCHADVLLRLANE